MRYVRYWLHWLRARLFGRPPLEFYEYAPRVVYPDVTKVGSRPTD
jgi:hypothetical protein